MDFDVATPLCVKWEDETPTPKVGDLESSETPECLEFDSRGQNTSHWDVLSVIGKVLKCRCPKCPRIDHLDICSPSYGQKKGRESNWQFDSWPLKVGNRPLPDIRIGSATWRWKALKESYNFGLNIVAIQLCSRELWAPEVPGLQPRQFRDSNLGVSRKCAIRMQLPRGAAENTMWGKVVASPSPGHGESCVSKCPWLVPTPKGVPNVN